MIKLRVMTRLAPIGSLNQQPPAREKGAEGGLGDDGDLAIGDGRDSGRQWSQPTSAFVGCVKEECLRDLDYERERTGYWHFDLIVLHSVSR
jgi:hypothetical protein